MINSLQVGRKTQTTRNESEKRTLSYGDVPVRRGGWCRSSSAGFTLFELILVVILVAVFAGILLGRFLIYQEMAEKAAMEQTAGAVRSALNLQVAKLLTQGRVEDIPKIATVNPMNFMTDQQRNYVGEFYEATLADIPPGSWYYDLKHQELVYLVFRGSHFVPDPDGLKRVRYKIGLVYNEELFRDAATLGKKDLGGVVLKEVAPYTWDVR